MKKKLTYFVSLLAVISVIAVSCEKFLNDAPQTSLTTGNAYKSASDIENALAGCYQIFYTDYYQWENVMLSDNRADNAYPGGSGEETLSMKTCFRYRQLIVTSIVSGGVSFTRELPGQISCWKKCNQ